MKKIGILYICTGKYDIFWEDFYKSSEKYFLNNLDSNNNKEIEKFYFVWTDAEEIYGEKQNKNIKKFYQEDMGWPNNTLLRFEMFLKQKEELANMDFLVFFNANILMVNNITTEEFLPNPEEKQFLLGGLQPGFYYRKRKEFPYEKNEKSTAFIPKNKGELYFMGALIGGVSEYFLKACEVIDSNTKEDLKNNLIAIFHDESHWNKYLVDRKDIKILTPEYLSPEGWNLRLKKEKKMILRDKDKILKRDLFAWKHDDKNKIKKYFLILKRKVGDILKKYRLKKY